MAIAIFEFFLLLCVEPIRVGSLLRLAAAAHPSAAVSKQFGDYHIAMAPKKDKLKKDVAKLSASGASSHRSDAPSHRGDTPSKEKRSSRGKAEKKGKSEKKKSALDAVSEEGVLEAELETSRVEPLNELLAPLEELLEAKRAELGQVENELESINEEPEEPDGGGSLPDEATPRKLVHSESFVIKRTQAMRIWKSFANAKLAEMASSLDAALHNDEKLRTLFAHMDADLGGRIDKDELKDALDAAGKKVTDEQLQHMFDHADEDGGGDIDYDEFANVVKGVKASRAAFIIERGVRRHQEAVTKKRTKLSLEALETAIRRALLTKTPKEVLAEFDVNKNGVISRAEFRDGVCNILKLEFRQKDLDALFDTFDHNRDHSIDINELQETFKSLKEVTKRIKTQVANLRAQRAKLKTALVVLEARRADVSAVTQASFDEDALLVVHRSAQHVDAKVGAVLNGRIKSESNPKGVFSFEDMVAKWDNRRKVEGFMDLDEFTTLVKAELTANKSKLTPAQTLFHLGQTALDPGEIQAQFAALDPEGKGSIQIRQSLKRMIDAEFARAGKDAALITSCVERKAAALEAQAAFKKFVFEFVQQEQEAAEAAMQTPLALADAAEIN